MFHRQVKRIKVIFPLGGTRPLASVVKRTTRRLSLVSVMTSGLINPHPGHSVSAALTEPPEPGLLDCLIPGDYSANGLVTVTHDRNMARLQGARLFV